MREADVGDLQTPPRSQRLGTEGGLQQRVNRTLADYARFIGAMVQPRAIGIRPQDAGSRIRADLVRGARLTTLTEFASTISHDINQPLSAAITNAHTALRWLNRPTPDLGEVRIALERIARDAGRTNALIGQTCGRFAKPLPDLALVDVNRMMREVLRATDRYPGRAPVRVVTAFDGALPKVLADLSLLRQVAHNLISNALDAMAEAPDRDHVLRLCSRREGESEIAVSVADTGVGLTTDCQQQIFEHFFTTKAGGLGLGLPIARSIVDSCGGRLTADSNRPHGAVFTFVMPIAEQPR